MPMECVPPLAMSAAEASSSSSRSGSPQDLLNLLSTLCHAETVAMHPFLQDLSFSNQPKQEDTWFLCRAKTENAEPESPYQAQTPPPKLKKEIKTDDLDLTGSPLKCSFNLEDDLDVSLGSGGAGRGRSRRKAAGVTYTPLTAKEARSLLSRYNHQSTRLTLQNGDGADSLPACWVLCDGKDPQGTIFLGSQRTRRGKGKSLDMHMITCSGPHEQKDPALKFERLAAKHSLVAPNGIKNTIEALAIYNLSGGLDQGANSDDEHDDEDGDGGVDGDTVLGQLQVCLHWPRPRQLLEKPSLDAATTLHVKLVPGDDKMGDCHAHWLELTCLRSFAAGLDNEGVTWRKRNEDERGVAEELVELLERVKQMEQMGGAGAGGRNKRPGGGMDDDAAGDDSIDKLEEILTASRQDLDFSDLLWTVLHKVESFKQLCFYLAQVLGKIQQEELRPFIYANSRTQLAKIIQNIIRGGEKVPDMEDSLPLEILVEIGMEKLKRDYAQALLSSYLATKDDLAPFLTSSSSDSAGRAETLGRLGQLHFLLELIVLLQTYLSPTKECLRGIVQQAIKKMAEDKEYDAKEKEFEFNVKIAQVNEKLLKMNPSVWQCRLHSENDYLAVETTAHLSVDPPMDYLQQLANGASVAAASAQDDDLGKPDVPYFYTVKSTTSTKI